MPHLNWEDAVVGHKVTWYTYKLATVYQNWNINETTMSTRSAEQYAQEVQDSEQQHCCTIPI